MNTMNSNTVVKVCRFCFKIIGDNNFDAIEDITRQMIDMILPKLNLDLTKEAVICKKCVLNLQKFFDFKSLCLDRKNRQSFVKSEGHAGIDLEDKHLDINENEKRIVSDSDMVCQFCMEETETARCIDLNEIKSIFITNIIQKHIQELTLNNTQEIITCEVCLAVLQSLSSFIMKCLDVEENIRQCVENVDVFDVLCDVQQIILVSAMQYEASCKEENEPEIVCLKTEIKNEDFMEVANLGGDINNDKNEIKLESSDSQSKINSSEIKQETDLTEHLLPHQIPLEMKPYKCERCLYGTNHMSSLNRHMLMIHQDTSEIPLVKCESCSFKTKHKHSIKQHMLTHQDYTEETIYRCDNCLYETKYRSGFKRHILSHQDVSEVTAHKCKTCLYKTKYKHKLKQHMLTHQNHLEVTKYKCENCSFETKHRGSFAYHMLSHQDLSKVTAYKCDKCSYETRHKNNLKSHIKLSHQSLSEIKTYMCQLCSFIAKRKNNLTQHMLIHQNSSEIKTYMCQMCSFVTKRKRGLKQHMLIHQDLSEGAKYKCKNCSYETKYREC